MFHGDSFDVILYAIPVFVICMILEALAFRFLPDDDMPGYEPRDTAASLTMGIGNVLIIGWKTVVLAAYAGAYLLAATTFGRQPTDLDRAVRRRRLRLLLVPPRPPRNPCVLGQPRHAPLQRALQPVDRAASDLDSVHGVAVLGGTRIPGLRAVDDPAAVDQPALPVLHSHRTDREARRPIEFVMNTPSHHRVHHGSNPGTWTQLQRSS